MSGCFILGVPSADANELKSLVQSLMAEPELVEHRYFDGASFIEALIPLTLSGATWATIRAWILARAEVQKIMRVSVDGIEITGMKPKDAERIIGALSHRITVDGDQ